MGTPATDLDDKPVITFQSETDSRLPRQDDSATFRWWEVPGTAHIDTYTFAAISATDYGDSPDTAVLLFDTMINVITGPSSVGDCQFGVNAGPMVWVFQAATHHLNAWVKRGTPPPIGPRMVTDDGTGAGTLVLDEDGNVEGSIRTPHLDVPIATLRGSGNVNETPPPPPLPPNLNFCVLFGTTFPFSEEKLDDLYRNHPRFVFKWTRSLLHSVREGFILP